MAYVSREGVEGRVAETTPLAACDEVLFLDTTVSQPAAVRRDTTRQDRTGG